MKHVKVLFLILAAICMTALLGACKAPCKVHDFQPATCLAPKTCTVCGTTEGSKSNHNWQYPTCTTERMCKDCGVTSGSALGHDWKPATCETGKTCTRCKLVSGPPEPHDLSPATCVDPPTCYRCFKVVGTPLDHTWTVATCTTPKTCTACGATEGEAANHVAGSNRRCKYCNLPMPKHKYAYLAAADFRSVKRTYSTATAEAAYLSEYINLEGDHCVVTVVYYRIISRYKLITLHNMTTGETITDPAGYYDKLANRAFGNMHLHYLDMETEVYSEINEAIKYGEKLSAEYLSLGT